MASIRIDPLDDVLHRYHNQLAALGDSGAQKAMARALNYEGKRAHVAVKRALRKQTSIPYGLLNRGVSTRQASTKMGGTLEFQIVGTGRPFPLKIFKPRQDQDGTTAFVWGKRQLYVGSFMGPRPGVLAPKLFGHVWHRVGKSRLPIHKSWGPNIPTELVKDASLAAFEAAVPRVVERVGKEIDAVMRGF